MVTTMRAGVVFEFKERKRDKKKIFFTLSCVILVTAFLTQSIRTSPIKFLSLKYRQLVKEIERMSENVVVKW